MRIPHLYIRPSSGRYTNLTRRHRLDEHLNVDDVSLREGFVCEEIPPRLEFDVELLDRFVCVHVPAGLDRDDVTMLHEICYI
jgi:hypothetical protein